VYCYAYGAHGIEVAVNVKTGEVKVLRVIAAFDPGQAINPKIVETQIDGGIGMGISSAFEEVIFDNGVALNANFADYSIHTMMDLPSGDNVKTVIAEAPHRDGPYGAKGIGEAVAVPIAPAIANAIYNAVGVRIKDLPFSAEKILAGYKK
jgi:CO/xanthine dehydrogenase Mo-binding subunit